VAELSDVLSQLVRFRDERDWAQFHTPRNLAAALAVEAAELQELMLWKSDAEVDELLTRRRQDVERECADVMIYALLLCQAIGADPEAIVREKLVVNGQKYPVDKARGSAAKYTEL
jgi:dCTP diphosphatase